MNYFVYIVCGSENYIEELNFSLSYLKYFSRYPIIVLTDTSRNKAEIKHDNIIDVKTPSHLPDHQAHLFLETRALHYLHPKENDVFCYLDSDVIAISDEINNIFNEYMPPVNFAKDHCTIDYFSPNVMNCKCLEEFTQRTKQYYEMKSNFPSPAETSKAKKEWKHLLEKFDRMKSRPCKHIKIIINYLYNRHIDKNKTFEFNNLIFNKTTMCWYNKAGELVGFDMDYHNKVVCQKYNVRSKRGIWYNKHNRIIQPQTASCHHLRQYLNKQYKLSIPKGFHHWNGGVFLFSGKAADFMDFWYNITFRETNKGVIKSYDDQSSLIVTAYHFGIENAIYLPSEYNFIADYGKESIGYVPGKGFTNDNFKTFKKPAFLHIYHHWGDKNWIIWQFILDIGKKLTIR